MARRPSITIEEAQKVPVNLGPFSDVTTSLVVMFMLSIPFLVESGIFITRSLAAKTPQMMQQAKKSDIKVNLYLRADGTVMLNKEPVDPAQLPDLIPRLLARSIEKKAILTADAEVVYESVIDYIDMLKANGASDVLIMKRKAATAAETPEAPE
ncbi:MAG: biopolymer transporter ExbD [candidate division WOR-3 bacterium]